MHMAVAPAKISRSGAKSRFLRHFDVILCILAPFK